MTVCKLPAAIAAAAKIAFLSYVPAAMKAFYGCFREKPLVTYKEDTADLPVPAFEAVCTCRRFTSDSCWHSYRCSWNEDSPHLCSGHDNT